MTNRSDRTRRFDSSPRGLPRPQLLRRSAGLVGIAILAFGHLQAQVTKPFPAHWGEPPAVQTRDLVELPDGYGQGSSTLANWISTNLATGKPAAEARALFACDFEAGETNKVPDDFLVLDGAFAVQAEEGNKFLELPGAPLDMYGVLFGPTTTNNTALIARVHGTNKGRRLPVLGLGLNGAGGLRLLLAPGKRVIEILKGDDSVARAAYNWEPGAWTWMRLQVRQTGPGEWQAEGRAWKAGKPEPSGWQVVYKEKSDLSPGRASVWGSPMSGTPIRFDDLKVTPAAK